MQESLELPTQAELNNPFLKLASTTAGGGGHADEESIPQPDDASEFQNHPDQQAIDKAKKIIAAKDALIMWAMELVDLKDNLAQTNDRIRDLKSEIEESQSSLIEAARHLKQLTETWQDTGEVVDADYQTNPADTQSQPATDESWRAFPLKSLSLPDTLRQALAENPGHPILTVGDIQAWTAKGKLLIDIPRVGQAKAEKIEQALETFWASRKQ